LSRLISKAVPNPPAWTGLDAFDEEQKALALTSRFTDGSSLRTWSKQDMGAKNMIASTLSRTQLRDDPREKKRCQLTCVEKRYPRFCENGYEKREQKQSKQDTHDAIEGKEDVLDYTSEKTWEHRAPAIAIHRRR
jgi:hypothetical protein